MDKIKCKVCGSLFSSQEIIIGHAVRNEIQKLIKIDIPDWADTDAICKQDLDNYRFKELHQVLEEEKGELEKLETEVLNSIKNNELISSNTHEEYTNKISFGDKIADAVAKFAGSWSFILSFFMILFSWVVLNAFIILKQPFDPYPFILLNLILSCLAAIQAPVIIMSQNRQESKDRLRAENDYKINLKSEIEIRTLHEKVDHLLLVQWIKLMEIQQTQIELLQDIQKEIKKNKN